MSTSATTTSFSPSEKLEPILANDFRRQWEDVREDALAAMERVGRSGWYVLGDEVRTFETALASYWGVRHAVGVASGLDAIEISLRILGCGPGDRVLTTPISAFATTLAIVRLGAMPVFVDTDQHGLIDLARCRDRLSRRPHIQYFVPVHLYGHSLDMEELGQLRDEFDLRMVEDCAQSIGTATGTAGQLAATSFYPTKNLGAMGDGGGFLLTIPRSTGRLGCCDAMAKLLVIVTNRPGTTADWMSCRRRSSGACFYRGSIGGRLGGTLSRRLIGRGCGCRAVLRGSRPGICFLSTFQLRGALGFWST